MAKDKTTETDTDEIITAVAVDAAIQPEIENSVVPEKPKGYVLKKSHGVVMNGRTSHHFAAGTSFEEEKDAELIALLAKTGAQFE